MASKKLTVRSVSEVQPSSKDTILWDTELKGFGLKVTPRGRRTFFLFYRNSDHVQRKPRIGNFPELRPEQARDIARQMLARVRRGEDPSSEKRAKRANRGDDKVSDFLPAYLAYKTKEGRKSIREIERIFNHDILPALGHKKAEEVTSREVTRLLDAIEMRSASVAWAVRRQLSAFYKWALPRLPEGTKNPVSQASRPPSMKPRERVLTEQEVKKLWLALETEPLHWQSAIRLLILTGQRREEVLGAKWEEFDLKSKSWTIPSVRSKNGKDHVVPLSDPVMKILEDLPIRTGRIFPSGTGSASKAAARIRKAMPGVPDWRWHDLRRTVATGMQRLGVRLEVTEAILNHSSGSRAGIVGVYQRHDWAKEKAVALRKWAREVDTITST